MDSSRRAVESYWRSKMIDEATSSEDKVTPVYKLDEICELLRSSNVSIVKEVSGFILKRLEHKSPIVIQKALRLIKYSVGKSSVEFRREMQRHSAAVRQLFHYRGQPDPLKGDALNKAVRDTAREAISAIFSEENKPQTATEGLSKRIQGFGSTNYEMPSEDRKSFLSEVVGIGSASIKHGLSSFSQSNSVRRNDNGSYRSPNLQRSLSIENGKSDRYEPVKLNNETHGSHGDSNSPASGPWGQDNMGSNSETRNGHASGTSIGGKTREERLLETIVTSGGVRLQPTRDAIQVFLVEAAKLDALALSHALESKLQSPVWQVRMKAVCVLESILRRKEDEHFAIVASYFLENKDVVVRCSESPQSSLREKSLKVLSLLGGQPTGGVLGNSEKSAKAETVAVHMPDLIDTGDSNDFFETKDTVKLTEHKAENPTAAVPSPLLDDLLGYGFNSGLNSTENKSDDDPFADVSFHTNDSKDRTDDLFSGMNLDNKPVTDEIHIPSSKTGLESLDIFGSDSELLQQQNHTTGADDLMAGMTISDSTSKVKKLVVTSATLPENNFSDSSNPGNRLSNGALRSVLGSQLTGVNANTVLTSSTLPFSVSPGYIINPAYNMQPMNFAAMGGYLPQQQYLAMMANFQHLSNFNAQNAGFNQSTGTAGDGNALPDIFQSSYPNQAPTSTMNSSKKEETRAFDFICDHLAAARDPKRVT